MNYYSFHIGDYAIVSKSLSLMEDLAYRRLLDLYYSTEKPIPSDIDRVCRLIGMREHGDAVSYVLSEFFLKSEDFWSNKRCDAEISKYHAKALRAKKANNSRWSKKTSDNAMKSDMISEANQIPTKNQEPRQAKEKIYKKEKPKRPRFKKPTIKEIKAYCDERNNGIEPQAFYDSNESKGWVVGRNKTPMKCWKAAIRTWEHNEAAKRTSDKCNNQGRSGINHDSTDWANGFNR